MKTRKQLPLIAKLNHIKVDVETVLAHCRENNLLDTSLYTDIKYSAHSKHQNFLVSNEFCKTNFFTEKNAPLLEGEKYKQLYLTDFDLVKASGRVELSQTNIFSRTRRLDPHSSTYLPEADELNYGVRNHLVSGPFETILDSFKSRITRVRLACLVAHYSIRPHVDYDPSYITRYHIPLVTNQAALAKFDKNNEIYQYHLPADGSVYFFNSGIKHWVENGGDDDRIHLIVDTHGQLDLEDYTQI
jgi:hypothetical protein